ncbi:MAG TPA: ABC transporter [Chloroflexi bacterium]|nr:ABC transporter [Chloroflexota bacterium]
MSAALTLWNKHMRKSMTNPEEAIGMLIQPVLWVVLFGIGMGSLLGTTEPGAEDAYITFMLPGIITLTALGGAIGGGTEWLNERLRGIVKEYLAAPIPRLSILFGNAFSSMTKSLLQALVIMIVGVIIGAKLSNNPLGWLGGLLLVAGYGLGFSGIAIAVASKTESPGGYHMLIFMLNLPLLFLSNALYPLQTMPSWMELAARINPTTYVVTGMRIMTFGTSDVLGKVDTIPLWLCFIVVAIFLTFGMALGYRSFKSSLK